MDLAKQIAKHFTEIHFGGNWTTSNLKDNLSDVSWQEATTKLDSFNTIATLVYHKHYYVAALIRVLEGELLNAKDEYSFDHPPIRSQEDWEHLVNKALNDAKHAASLIEKLPNEKFAENFTDEKYGNYYRNIHGIIEHLHYHLGQIVILKKLIRQSN